MEKLTYSQGKYSMIRLRDGSKYFIEVLDNQISVRKVRWLAIPSKLIWQLQSPSRLRTPSSTTQHAIKLLDIILSKASNCQDEKELLDILNNSEAPEVLEIFKLMNAENMQNTLNKM